jgi:hypothetical protein
MFHRDCSCRIDLPRGVKAAVASDRHGRNMAVAG